MKKKTLALLATMALVASMTACGGKTEEAAGSNVNEPTVESTVESQSAESTTQEVTESTETSSEAPASEEAPVAEASYEISDVIYPNGSAPESIDFDYFYSMGQYQNPEIIQPYYTITNTSDSAYAIRFENLANMQEDLYFEAGESIVVPAALYQDENGAAKWCNLSDAKALQYSDGIETSEANSAQNRVQEMMTITYDESKILYENVMSIDIELPENASGDGGAAQYLPCYVIYYDEAGNVLSAGTSCDWNVISYADKTFTYPAMYYTTTGETFVWAKADVYYSYTLAQ